MLQTCLQHTTIANSNRAESACAGVTGDECDYCCAAGFSITATNSERGAARCSADGTCSHGRHYRSNPPNNQTKCIRIPHMAFRNVPQITYKTAHETVHKSWQLITFLSRHLVLFALRADAVHSTADPAQQPQLGEYSELATSSL